MEISWVSRQGASRQTNNDYVALKANDDHLSAVIVDASDRGKAPTVLLNIGQKRS